MGTGGTIPHNIVKGKNSFNFNHHDHISLFYSSLDDQLPVVFDFMKEGLTKNNRCVYIFGESGYEHVTEKLISSGIDIDLALKNGDLMFINKKKTYLRRDPFDPDFMIELLKRFTDQATSNGYRGLWVTGEMSWASDGYPGSEKLMEYEAKLNFLLPRNRIAALCQYDISMFPSERIIQAIQTHPGVIYKNERRENKYYLPPRNFLRVEHTDDSISRILKEVMGYNEPEEVYPIKFKLSDMRRRLTRQDTAHQKNELKVIRESESYFRKLVNLAPVALIMTDTGGKCLFANEAWRLLSGLNLQKSIGTGWQNAIYPDDVAVIGEWWYRGEKKHTDHGTECRIRSLDGDIKWVELKAAPLYDDNGSWIGIIASFFDFSNLKESENRRLAKIPGINNNSRD